MSNKTQLQTNNNKYASLIETLRGKALPGGDSGATINTCNVQLKADINNISHYAFTVLQDGEITTLNVFTSVTKLITIPNIVCGSLCHIVGEGPAAFYSKGCKIINDYTDSQRDRIYKIYQITANPGETATITLSL